MCDLSMWPWCIAACCYSSKYLHAPLSRLINHSRCLEILGVPLRASELLSGASVRICIPSSLPSHYVKDKLISWCKCWQMVLKDTCAASGESTHSQQFPNNFTYVSYLAHPTPRSARSRKASSAVWVRCDWICETKPLVWKREKRLIRHP